MKRPIMTVLSTLLLAGMSACTGSANFSDRQPTIETAFLLETPIPATVTQPVVVATETLQPEAKPETPTPDPCSVENIGAEVEKIHKVMREFDDASSLASNTPSQQLSPAIAEMQRIRREAEDLKVPVCLETLKHLQLNHMETVIDTMLAFYAGSNPEIVNAGILKARQEYELYMVELANLLGLTPVPAPTQLVDESTPAVATLEWTKILTVALKADLSGANMRAAPSKDGVVIDYLYPGQQADVFGRNEAGDWFLLGIPAQPDKKAWVASSVLDILDGDVNALPVVTFTP